MRWVLAGGLEGVAMSWGDNSGKSGRQLGSACGCAGVEIVRCILCWAARGA